MINCDSWENTSVYCTNCCIWLWFMDEWWLWFMNELWYCIIHVLSLLYPCKDEWWLWFMNDYDYDSGMSDDYDSWMNDDYDSWMNDVWIIIILFVMNT